MQVIESARIEDMQIESRLFTRGRGMKTIRFFSFFLLAVAILSCESDDSDSASNTDSDSSADTSSNTDETAEDTSDCSKQALAQSLNQQLAAVTTDADFAFYVEDAAQNAYTYNRGAATMDTPYESASTSKWVSAAIVLTLVDKGLMSLDDSPQDYLTETEWPVDASHPLYSITLRQLLSFTSGLSDEAACHNLPNIDFFTCVAQIAENNLATSVAPGAEFYYASNHLQVAGAMAVRAGGYADWASLFAAFKAGTGLFPSSDYNLPSTTNPRLAGGMTWTGTDYVNFIRAFKTASFYNSADMVALAASDQLGGATIRYSPANERTGEDWHYGFGMWMECHSPTFNCTNITQVSSAGAFGAYPFWNTQHDYMGIVARQGELGTGYKGFDVFDAVRTTVDSWAVCPNP
jgi:CubicO group peptidase (beta-lactamase class C family)